MDLFTDSYSTSRRSLIARLQHCCSLIEALPKVTEELQGIYSMLSGIIASLAIEYKPMPKTQQRIETSINQIETLIHELPSANPETFVAKTNKLRKVLTAIRDTQRNEAISAQPSYNSEKYYTQELARLAKEKEQLQASLAKLADQQHGTTEELQRRDEELQQLKKAVQDITSKASQLEKEKQELQRQKDAQDTLKEQIKDTFSNLQEYIQPIEDEQKRLKRLYGGYITIGLFFLVALIVSVLYLICNRHEITCLTDYIPFYLPISVCAAFIWVSIFQLNRAQRQLLVIAHQLHHIKYIEGMLLTINDLSSNVSEGVATIKSVINNIIQNYLQTDYNKFDATLQTEISKDKFNLKEVLEFMKESKELFTK